MRAQKDKIKTKLQQILCIFDIGVYSKHAKLGLYESVDSYVVVETKDNDGLHFCKTEMMMMTY